ncbi:MAG: DUF2461 domain-containing protein [Cyanobacteria bacterium J06632_22]
MSFLAALSENNTRAWFEAHKAEYKALRQPFVDYMNELAQQIAHFDSEIQTRLIDPKTVKVFRINRDVRFSKNKDPYKTSFSGSIAAGQSPAQPVYYLGIEPGGVMAGVGIYMPPSNVLGAIREKIDAKPKPLEQVLANKRFLAAFPNGIETDLKLKTAPKGYPKDHPSIHLLRFKSFTALRRFEDEAIFEDDFTADLLEGYEAAYGFVTYLREATAGIVLEG